jgi:hypothetical protein
MGLTLALMGFVLALAGYAPLFSPVATSLPMIIAGGFLISIGAFMTFYASARTYDEHELAEVKLIRP